LFVSWKVLNRLKGDLAFIGFYLIRVWFAGLHHVANQDNPEKFNEVMESFPGKTA